MPSVFQPTAESLLGIDLFKGVDARGRARIVGQVKGRLYAEAEPILAHGERSTDAYFVLSGRVRAKMFSRAGKEVSFKDFGPGEVFGDLSAIDHKPRSASVVSLQDTHVLVMTSDAFQGLVERFPSFGIAMLQELSALVRELSDRVVEFSTLAVRNRVHAELLRLAKENGASTGRVEIKDPPRHAELAARISTVREAVTRELNHLEEEGFIERVDGRLFVVDFQELAELVERVKGAMLD